MFSSISTLNISIALFGLIFAWNLFRRTLRSSTASLPPGTQGTPIDRKPSRHALSERMCWDSNPEQVLECDITSVSILGQRIVVINSAQIAMTMLDKKSSIYSDRPLVAMGGELLFGNNATIKRFLSMVELETHRFLKRISDKPEELSAHIRKTAGAIILKISHGYMVQEENDPFVELAEMSMDQFSLSTAPGGFLVNIIPILRHVPGWLPGARFKRTAREWASTLNDFMERPHNYVKQEMAAGNTRLSLTSSELEGGVSTEEEFDVKWLAGSLYAAILLYPEVQAKAQAEIDAVIGDDRLPRFDDRERLPYVNALVLEVTRWHTVGPTGIPHCVIEDDVQFGYFIPKGSVVLANIWKMLHDPTVYNEPFRFNPDRFIRTESKEPELEPYKMAFGFGHTGKVLADASLFISCAMVLAVFNISKYSENSVVFEPNTEHTAGTISHPSPFKCTIKARSRKALELIDEERIA
ncbi:cytochrome P450 [Desarmillaria ectypa]|nr:cytochrome P450 [Desarmillaria ectypa]